MKINLPSRQLTTRKFNRIQSSIFDLIADDALTSGCPRVTLAEKARLFLGELRAELGIGGAS